MAKTLIFGKGDDKVRLWKGKSADSVNIGIRFSGQNESLADEVSNIVRGFCLLFTEPLRKLRKENK